MKFHHLPMSSKLYFVSSRCGCLKVNILEYFVDTPIKYSYFKNKLIWNIICRFIIRCKLINYKNQKWAIILF
jgi:hypothetical protein